MSALVNVLCVTHNNASTIEEMLRGLARDGEHVATLVVVDNASSDATIATTESLVASVPFPVHVVRNANEGFAGGMRRAGAHSSVDPALPALCLNPDLVLAEGALPAMLRALAHRPRAAVLTSPLVTADGTPDSALVRRLPGLTSAALYSVLGRFTPARWRYNRLRSPAATAETGLVAIEATTGALMLVNPLFRRADAGIFDCDYWMYGEDLQLCRDAAAEGWEVVLTDGPPSLHLKGVSSGRPRSWRSNRAFHSAMFLYYRKNLAGGPLLTPFVGAAIALRLLLSHASGSLVRVRRRHEPAPSSLASAGA